MPTIIDRLKKQPSRRNALPFVRLLPEKHDIQIYLTQLRDEKTDIGTFRENVSRLTDYLLQTILKLKAKEIEITTPLGEKAKGIKMEPTFPASIFFINRAGLTMGLQAARLLPRETPIGEFDIHRDEKTLEGIIDGYNLPPDISNRQVLILDPMNATGGSVMSAWKVIDQIYSKQRGQEITCLQIGNIISSPFGVLEIHKNLPSAKIYSAALDHYLTHPNETEYPPGYIVPGLGDAGNRQFGKGRSKIFKDTRRMLKTFVNFNDPSRIKKSSNLKSLLSNFPNISSAQ